MRKRLVISICAVLAISTGTAFFWPRVADAFATTFPRTAWRYGTADMQETAALQLAKQIHTGMPYEQVIDLLGPGSLGWPWTYDPRANSPGDFTASFNVRSWYNTGLDVHFTSNKVVSVDHYN